MKRIWTILLLAGAVRAADVTVYQTGHHVVDNAVRNAAMGSASKLFAGIGIRLDWKAGRRDGRAATTTILLQYTMGTPEHPGAMAFARPFDPERVITVMYDRILAESASNPSTRAAVLAYTLTHEIGHVLMRSDTHSREGIMKASWGDEDRALMLLRRLRFLPEEEVLIRQGLERDSAEAFQKGDSVREF